MAIHAAANIAIAVENFRGRGGYASLGGLILNRRDVKNGGKVEACVRHQFRIVGVLPRSKPSPTPKKELR